MHQGLADRGEDRASLVMTATTHDSSELPSGRAAGSGQWQGGRSYSAKAALGGATPGGSGSGAGGSSGAGKGAPKSQQQPATAAAAAVSSAASSSLVRSLMIEPS